MMILNFQSYPYVKKKIKEGLQFLLKDGGGGGGTTF